MVNGLTKEYCSCLVKKMRLTPARVSIWALIIILPIAVNLLIWQGFLIPNQVKFRSLQELDSLYSLKPKMELLLSENDRLMQKSDYRNYWHEDAASALKKIRELAGDYRLDIEEISLKDQDTNFLTGAAGSDQGYSKMNANLQAIGTYSQITKWIHDLERRPGFQIENWQIRFDANSGSSRLYMDLKMTMGKL